MSVKIIVPAAGFGKRMGSPEAKEMLVLKESQEKPLIEHAIAWAQTLKCPIHVITRKEKQSLLRYLENHPYCEFITIQCVEATREWPETMLLTQPYLAKQNILILPDTRWEPATQVAVLYNKLASQSENPDNLIYLCTETQNTHSEFPLSATDGFIASPLLFTKNANENFTYIVEKPVFGQTDFSQAPEPTNFHQWGLIGFSKEVAPLVFKAHLKATLLKEVQTLPLKSEILFLTSFKDLTRSIPIKPG